MILSSGNAKLHGDNEWEIMIYFSVLGASELQHSTICFIVWESRICR